MPRPAILRFFTEDLGTKVLALLIAVVLWFAMSFLGTRTVVVQEVPVGTVNLPGDLALAAPLEPVDVKIRAPRTLLRQREAGDLVRAFVDLAGRGLGAQSSDVVVTPTDARVDVVVVVPDRINLTLDPVVQRQVSVVVIPDGTPADGYAVGAATAEPKTVLARGALGRLQSVSGIEVKVPIGGASATVEGEFSFSPPEGITVVSPDRVRVKLDITQSEVTKTLGVRVVTTGTPAAGYWIRSVSSEPSVVTVRGPREAVGERTFVETAAVDVGGARAPVERTADLSLPEKVAVQGGEPRVTVKLDIVPLEGSKEVTAAVQVGDVPDGLRVTNVSPGSLRVTVRGSGEAFDRLRAEDVRVVLSASGRSTGTFSVRPEVNHVRAPSGAQVVSVEGVDVSVTLEGT